MEKIPMMIKSFMDLTTGWIILNEWSNLGKTMSLRGSGANQLSP